MKKRALTTIRTNARTFLLARLLLYALGISAAAKRENRSKSIGRLTGNSSTGGTRRRRRLGRADLKLEPFRELSESCSMYDYSTLLAAHTYANTCTLTAHARTHTRYSAGNPDFRSRLKSLCVRV